MRLGALFLVAVSVVAQSPKGLPWDKAPNLPWRAIPFEGLSAGPLQPSVPQTGPLRVTIDPDGALRVVDAKGIILLRTGLPGRPRKLWRDGGVEVAGTSGTWHFPAQTPLREGLGALPLGQSDFRLGLAGTLWILDDEERLLTVLHPATSRVIYLSLPRGTGLDLQFLPDQLLVRQGLDTGEIGRSRILWSLPWLSLLPQFILLGNPVQAPLPGTALVPYLKE